MPDPNAEPVALAKSVTITLTVAFPEPVSLRDASAIANTIRDAASHTFANSKPGPKPQSITFSVSFAYPQSEPEALYPDQLSMLDTDSTEPPESAV